MAVKCEKCSGIIPDLYFGGKYVDRSDCKNHIKPLNEWKLKHENIRT